MLLVLAFLLRLAAGWVWQSRLDDKFGDGRYRELLAARQGHRSGTSHTSIGDSHARVFRTPGYPVLLAPIFWLTDDHRTAVLLARAEAALLATLAVLGVWGLTRLLFDDRAALLAAVLATFYPGAIVLGVLILSEAPFCPLMLLQLVLWVLAWNAPIGRSEEALRLRRWPGGRGGNADAAQLAAVHAVCRGRGDAGGADCRGLSRFSRAPAATAVVDENGTVPFDAGITTAG